MTIYLDHFGLDAPPFKITPNTGFFFPGANRGATLDALLYAVTHGEGLIKVVGEVGSGKTMLSRVLLERLPPHIETVYIATPSLSREDILLTLAEELGLATDGTRTGSLIRNLQGLLIEKYAAGGQVVVLIDEAHAMPDETLEEIRLLSNLESSQHKLLQIVLFAQPELDTKLARQEMRQLRERITYSFRLPPLATDDVLGYLEFRLRAAGYRGPQPFMEAATRLIATTSEGLVRRINILADKALLSAFAGGRHAVELEDARRASNDCEFGAPQQPAGARPPRHWLKTAAFLLALSSATAAGWILRDVQPPPTLMTDAQHTAQQSTPIPATPIMADPPAAPPPALQTPPADAGTSAAAEISPPPAGAVAADPEPAPLAAAAPATAPEAIAPSLPFTIQIAYARAGAEHTLSGLKARAQEHAGAEAVHLIPSRIGQREVTALCLGQFASRDEADNARRALPEALQRFQPQIRSFSDLSRKPASQPAPAT